MNIIKYYLTQNRCYQRNVKRTPIGIQLHTIGTAQGTARSVADYWNQAAVSACVHYIVDCDTPGKVLYTLPEDVRCWGDAGWGNDNLISFEICESDFMEYKGGATYNITNAAKFKADITRGYNTSVLLCADICKRYSWDPEDKLPNGMYLISSHDEGRRAGLSSAHVDPEHIWPRYGFSMQKFRSDVKAAMNGVVIEQPAAEEMYRVRKTWTDVDSQLFAGTLNGAKDACLPGYSVYDENGKAVYTLEKNGFQAADLKGLTEAERIEMIAPLYQASMEKTGLLASVGIAQFCLESGYGTTDLAEFANNLHGMKKTLSGDTWPGSVWDGESVYGKESPEVYNGVTQMIYSEFRKYPKCEDSIADRAAYFANAMNGSVRRYPGIVGEKDYKTSIDIIKSGGYATDPDYAVKLVDLVERWQLFKYDEGISIPDTGDADILPDTEIPWYRVRLSWGTNMDGQIGAFQTLEKAIEKVNENTEYKVFDSDGNIVYEIVKEPSGENEIHKVQSGAYVNLSNAKAQVDALNKKGISSFVFQEDGYHKVQVGAYEVYANAVKKMEEVKKTGFPAIIKTYSQQQAEDIHIILRQCEKFQKRLMEDMEKDIRWEYHNPSKYLKEQWQQASKNKKYACNCALLARWALKEAGLIPQDTGIFYGKLGGSISWGKGTKEAIEKNCELINIQNKTVKQLIDSGDLKPGDIVTYVGLQHTNIYAGGNKWYDAGHAYCSGSGEGALYNSWYGVGQYDNQKVGWIIRKK